MRIQNLKKFSDGWSMLDFRTTYKYGWQSCIAYAEVIYRCTRQPEILTSNVRGENFQWIDINDAKDVKNIDKSAVIQVRGANKMFDNVPFQFIFCNQTDIVRLCMPTKYLESLRKNETEFLSEDEQKHAFDKFMDSLELNGQMSVVDSSATKRTVEQIEKAFDQYDEFCSKDGSDVVLHYDNGLTFNVTRIVEKIRKANNEM